MDKSRQQFEYWYFNNHSHEQKYPLHKDESGEYFYDRTRNEWEAWQASRESLINSLEPDAVISRHSNKTNFSFEKSKFGELIKQGFIPLYRLDK